MTKLFIDSDVILDLLVQRNEYEASAELFSRIEEKKYKGFTSPIVFANVHYIMSKYGGKTKSIKNLRKLRKLLSVFAVDEEIIDEALYSDGPDFEDSIQYITAYNHGTDFILTRNKKNFKDSKIPVLSASEFLEIDIKK